MVIASGFEDDVDVNGNCPGHGKAEDGCDDAAVEAKVSSAFAARVSPWKM